MAYALKFNIDTWLKLNTAQGSSLPEDQRQLIRARTTLPLLSFEQLSGNHLKVTFGQNEQGQQIQYKGRNTWYVYEPAVEVLRLPDPVKPLPDPVKPSKPPSSTDPAPTSPSTDGYTLQFKMDTWLKTSTAQAADLSGAQRQIIQNGTILPIIAFKADQNHLQVTLGKDETGRQLQYQGRNTWYVYKPAVEVLLNGQPIEGYALKFTTDTWLKQDVGQAIDLLADQKQFIPAGTVLPLAGFKPEQSHLKVTFGDDEQGQPIRYQGRNTWYVYGSTAQVLRNGKPFDLRPVTNAKGLRLIKNFEGLRLTAYQDAVGVWTIGYGTTRGVYPGMRITQAQAEEFLRQDLKRFETAVDQLVKVDLSEDQFAALVAFTYNVGEGALASSTLLKLLNQGDYQGAANELPRWNKAGGRELAGLTRRRNAERALFLGEDFTRY